MVKRESERNSRVGRTRCLCCDGDGWEEGGSDDSEQGEEEQKDGGGEPEQTARKRRMSRVAAIFANFVRRDSLR